MISFQCVDVIAVLRALSAVPSIWAAASPLSIHIQFLCSLQSPVLAKFKGE